MEETNPIIQACLDYFELELEEEFKFKNRDEWNKNKIYKFTNEGLFLYNASEWEESIFTLKQLLKKQVESLKFPKNGESYFYPDITGISEEYMYNCDVYRHSHYAFINHLKNTIGVYKTKEEAIERAKEILELI